MKISDEFMYKIILILIIIVLICFIQVVINTPKELRGGIYVKIIENTYEIQEIEKKIDFLYKRIDFQIEREEKEFKDKLNGNL